MYSALTKVECLLLMNTIFLMDGMFKGRTYLMDSPYESGGGVASYENLGRFSRALMNIQVGCMTYLCQLVLYSS